MAYFIYRSSDTQTPFAIINEQTMNTTSSSIALVGKRRLDYGNSQQQNQIWMLENFASGSAPSNPITGQLWYDTAHAAIKVFNGAVFVRVANTYVSGTAPTEATLGQQWFNPVSEVFNIYDGNRWVEIGGNEESIVYAIVFGS